MPAWRGALSVRRCGVERLSSWDMTPKRWLEVTMWSASCHSKRPAQSQCFLTRGSGQQQGADRHGAQEQGGCPRSGDRGWGLTQGDGDVKEGPDPRDFLEAEPVRLATD